MTISHATLALKNTCTVPFNTRKTEFARDALKRTGIVLRGGEDSFISVSDEDNSQLKFYTPLP